MSSANAAAKKRRVNVSTINANQNFQPSQQNFQPSQQNFQPSQQNFQPSQQNFQPSQQNFQSSQQNFQSSQQNFQPSQQSFQSSSSPNASSSSSSSSQTPNSGLMTLPQVIAFVDSRLIKLENKANEIVDAEDNSNEEYFQEFETRFEIMAQEIAEMKQIVLSLQSYTMDVNRILMEDRLPKSSSSVSQNNSL